MTKVTVQGKSEKAMAELLIDVPFNFIHMDESMLKCFQTAFFSAVFARVDPWSITIYCTVVGEWLAL
jgi:hypothetical protein